MTIIITFEMKNEFANLENNIKKLKLSQCSITFQMIIQDSIKLMFSMSQSIKNKNNSFGKRIPTELLINIISFLPCKYFLICKNVCENWFNSLKNNISKKTLSLKPKNMRYSGLLNLNFIPRKIYRINNNIYTSDNFEVCKIDIGEFELVKETNPEFKNIIYLNNNYIFLREKGEKREIERINIFSSNMKFINYIFIGVTSQDLIIDNNNNILISSRNKFHIYNLEGKIINSWDLIDNHTNNFGFRKIASNDKEIFMVDSVYNCVCVFSYEGKLIRSWGKKGHEPGNFLNPWGITIYREIVFVVDTGNRRIQAFNYNGEFIFESVCEKAIDIGSIIIAYDNAYVNDWETNSIIKFELIYN